MEKFRFIEYGPSTQNNTGYNRVGFLNMSLCIHFKVQDELSDKLEIFFPQMPFKSHSEISSANYM